MTTNLWKYNLSSAVLARLEGLDLSECLSEQRTKALTNCTYADVWKGWLERTGKPDQAVAIKLIRFYTKQDIKLLFEKEIYIWSKLRHENVLPLLGYAFDKDSGYPLLISKWMDRGSAWDYVTENSDVNPSRLIVGIARGLGYLHEKGVIHSDIKGANVLVSASEPPKAVISDFGTARMIQASLTLGLGSQGERGTVRWMAYELFSASDWEYAQVHTKATDVWAFGMTVYELFTRQLPYHNIMFEQAVVEEIKKGILPSFPESASSRSKDPTGILRKICLECWKHDPKQRITMDAAIKLLESSPVFEDYAGYVDGTREDSDDESSFSVENTDIYDQFESQVHCVRFSLDGKYFAVGCERAIHVYNANSGLKEQIFDLDLSAPPDVRSLSFINVPGGLALCAGDDKVRICHMTERSQFSIEAGMEGILCLICSGTRLVCGMRDGTARIINFLTRETITTLRGSGAHAAITSIAISMDGHFVATGSSEGARIWNVSNVTAAEPVRAIQGPVNAIAFTPSSDMMIIASGMLIKGCDISGAGIFESKTFAGHSDDVMSIAVSRDGHWIMSGSKDGTVRFWTQETGQVETICEEYPDEVVSVDFCSVSNRFVTARRSGQVRLWNYNRIE